jgi:hypothetical protein
LSKLIGTPGVAILAGCRESIVSRSPIVDSS